MKTNHKQDDRIAKMTFSSVYPHYVEKVTKKKRSIQELHEAITWLTGFSSREIENTISDNLTFKEFFEKASLNKKASLIKGSICGYKIEKIENPLTKKVRMLDKLVDDLAKGKSLEKMLRN